MKKVLVMGLAIAVLITGVTWMKTSFVSAGQKRVLRHVVLFKYKAEATPAQIQDVEKNFLALKGKIKTVLDIEAGNNVSIENMNQGFTDAFMVTFADEAGRAAYLPHPDHKKFAGSLGPVIDKVLVIDFWSHPAK